MKSKSIGTYYSLNPGKESIITTERSNQVAPGHKLYSCPASSTMKVTVRIDQTGVMVTHVLHHTGTFQLWLNLLASMSGWCTGQICVSVVSALIDFNFSQNTYICTVLVKIYVLLAN